MVTTPTPSQAETAPTTAVTVQQPRAPMLPPGYEPYDVRPRVLGAEDVEDVIRLAAIAHKAGLLPDSLKTPEAAAAVMIRGVELGMPPMAAVARLYVVNNKVEMETQVMMGLVRKLDPTSQFVFERYARDGATVALYRHGRLQIRVDFGEEDRKSARLGMKPMGQWKSTNGNPPKRYFEAATDADGRPKYSEDFESPWHKYPRDMYAYRAVARCCRLGASDIINMIGTTRDLEADPYPITLEAKAAGDEAFEPHNQLTAALVEGKLTMAEVVSSDRDQDEPQPVAAAERPARPRTPAAAVNPDERATPKEKADAEKALMDLKHSIDLPSYDAFYRQLRADYFGGTPEAPKPWNKDALTHKTAAEVIQRAQAYAAGGAPPDDAAASAAPAPAEEPAEGEYSDVAEAGDGTEEQSE